MQIDLETHIEDITNLLMYEGLEDVILIGHSYAGMVITGVADRMPVRVAHLVYLDAVVPKSGESALDLTGAELASAMREWIDKSEGNRRVPSIRSGPGFYGVTDPDDIKWMAARLTDQPSATYEQPLRLKGKGFSGLCTYIRCSQSEGLSPKVFARVHSDAIFKTIEIQASHDVMITDPQLLARTLLGL
jgi:pimeloyl-ACP methyl ester carboxylesterase